MSYEDLIIKTENEDGPKFALIVDDHKKHIRSHLKNVKTLNMVWHILSHIKLMVIGKWNDVRHIRLEEVIRRENGKN